MTATQINRRKALTVVAAAPAAVACASVPAAAGEDAELIRLWEEWNAQTVCCRDAHTVEQDIEEKLWDEEGHSWIFGKLDTQGKHKYRALFLSRRHNDDSVKSVVFKARTYQLANQRVDEISADLVREREARRAAAGRRLGYGKAQRTLQAAVARRDVIEDQIASRPAQGLYGVAVKLALWQQFPSSVETAEKDAVETAYETIVKLTGFDPAAQAETW